MHEVRNIESNKAGDFIHLKFGVLKFCEGNTFFLLSAVLIFPLRNQFLVKGLKGLGKDLSVLACRQ